MIEYMTITTYTLTKIMCENQWFARENPNEIDVLGVLRWLRI